jgi:hypothetical protein
MDRKDHDHPPPGTDKWSKMSRKTLQGNEFIIKTFHLKKVIL